MKQIKVIDGRSANALEKNVNKEMKSLQNHGYDIVHIKYIDQGYFTRAFIMYDAAEDNKTPSDMKSDLKRFFGGYPEDITVKMYKEAIHLIATSSSDEESYKMISTITLPLRQLASKAMMVENEELANAAEEFSKSFKYYEAYCLS